jgi:hypothetical protein
MARPKKKEWASAQNSVMAEMRNWHSTSEARQTTWLCGNHQGNGLKRSFSAIAESKTFYSRSFSREKKRVPLITVTLSKKILTLVTESWESQQTHFNYESETICLIRAWNNVFRNHDTADLTISTAGKRLDARQRLLISFGTQKGRVSCISPSL